MSATRQAMTDLGGLQPGALMAGRYQVGEAAGSRGAIHIFAGTIEDDGAQSRPCVIEVLRRPGTRPEEFQAFLSQGELLAAIHQPHVVPVLCTHEFGDAAAAVLAGEPLPDLATIARREKLSLLDCLQAIADVAAVLAALHAAGIVHRNVHPGAIVRGTDGRWRLAAFERADRMDAGGGSHLGLPGALEFMAPEFFQSGRMDARSDVYGAGAVLYTLVAGRPPVAGGSAVEIMMQHLRGALASPRRLSPDLPAAIDALVMHCLGGDPHQRYQTAQHLLDALFSVDPTLKRPLTSAEHGGAAVDTATAAVGDALLAAEPRLQPALAAARRPAGADGAKGAVANVAKGVSTGLAPLPSSHDIHAGRERGAVQKWAQPAQVAPQVTAQAVPQSGAVLGGRKQFGPYQLYEQLSHDPRSPAYKAIDARSGVPVVIRFLRTLQMAGAIEVQQVEQELRQAELLGDCEGVARSLALDITRPTGGIADPPYVVREYVDGVSLRRLLDDQDHLPVGRALHLSLQVVQALECADRHALAHGALHPENVYVRPDGGVRVVDWGLRRARRAAAEGTVAAGGARRQIGYQAPEDYRRADRDIRSDIFCLGVLLYELIAGAPPFPRMDGSEMDQLRVIRAWAEGAERPSLPGVPEAIERIVFRALDPNPLKRYQGPQPLREEIEQALQFIEPSPPKRRAYILGPSGRAIDITRPDVVLGRLVPGREPYPDVSLADEPEGGTVSRTHARIYFEEGRWWLIQHVEVLNYTYLNGRRLAKGEIAPLGDGDRLKLGEVPLVFHTELP